MWEGSRHPFGGAAHTGTAPAPAAEHAFHALQQQQQCLCFSRGSSPVPSHQQRALHTRGQGVLRAARGAEAPWQLPSTVPRAPCPAPLSCAECQPLLPPLCHFAFELGVCGGGTLRRPAQQLHAAAQMPEPWESLLLPLLLCGRGRWGCLKRQGGRRGATDAWRAPPRPDAHAGRVVQCATASNGSWGIVGWARSK